MKDEKPFKKLVGNHTRFTAENGLLWEIETGTINETDGRLALEFIKEYVALKSLNTKTKDKHFFADRYILRGVKSLGYSLATLNKQAVIQVIEYLREGKSFLGGKEHIGEETKSDYFQRFKIFYNWCIKNAEGGDKWDAGAKEAILNFRYKVDKNLVEKKGILKPQDVLNLVTYTDFVGYKAFFVTLYESGTRAGEIITLKVGDVVQTGNGEYNLNLRASKTVKRTIPLMTYSVRYLEAWLKQHPYKDNPNAPLWYNSLGTPLEVGNARLKLIKLLKRAGIKTRKISMHSFRHSRASELCHDLTEAQLCKFFGWRIGSNMPQVYVRSEAVDVLGALRRSAGKEEYKPVTASFPSCWNCGHINPPDKKVCDVCRLPMDAKKAFMVKTALYGNMEKAISYMIEVKMQEEIQKATQKIKENGGLQWTQRDFNSLQVQ